MAYEKSESARENFSKFIYQFQPKTKTLIRKLERILIKLYRQNVSLSFNQTCINERLLPNYTHTHTRTHTHTHTYIYIYIYIYHHQVALQHGFPPSLSLSLSLSLFLSCPNHPSLPVGPSNYIQCPHRADINKFLLVRFYGISTLVGYLMPNPYIYIYIYINCSISNNSV